jgi:site-specific DNA recombinase
MKSTPATQPLRYLAYTRKSEMRQEYQLLSLPAQRESIERQFPDLNIVRWMEPESQSAFKPGRPVFNKMMEMIERGEADAIVAYHPNRCARNEIDSARITYALRGPLRDLKFCTYNFEGSAEGVMWLQFTMNQGQYESTKQGRDVRRGMKYKARGGERPGQVPHGYKKVPICDENGEFIKNSKDKLITKTEKDPERFELVKTMWRLLLYEGYTPAQIRKKANNEWGFTTRPIRKKGSKREGGNPLGTSGIYRIFSNRFYAGQVKHNDEHYQGEHEAMITEEEYDFAQKLLGANGRPRTNKNEHPFGGIIKCGVCGCQIVAKPNVKLIKSTAKIKTYLHYRCTRKSVKRPCDQRKYTSVEVLNEQIDAELSKYEIIPEFRELALSILHRTHKVEVHDRTAIYKSQQKRRDEIQEQIDNLTGQLSRGIVEEDDYTRQRDLLKSQLVKIDQEMRGTEQRAENWVELTEKAFDFTTYARIRFRETQNLKEKGDILRTLGAEITLKDNQLTIVPNKWLAAIGKEYPSIYREYQKVRTNKKTPLQEMPSEIIDSWRARRDLNPRHSA